MRLRNRNLSEGSEGGREEPAPAPPSTRRRTRQSAQARDAGGKDDEDKASKTDDRAAKTPKTTSATPRRGRRTSAARSTTAKQAKSTGKKAPSTSSSKSVQENEHSQEQQEPGTPTSTPAAAEAPAPQTARRSSRRTRDVPDDNWHQEDTSSPVLTRRRARKLGTDPETPLKPLDEMQPRSRRSSKQARARADAGATSANQKQPANSTDKDTQGVAQKAGQKESQRTDEKGEKAQQQPAKPHQQTTEQQKRPAMQPSSDSQQKKKADKKVRQTKRKGAQQKQVKKQKQAKQMKQKNKQPKQNKTQGKKKKRPAKASPFDLEQPSVNDIAPDDDDAPTEVSLGTSKEQVLRRLAAEKEAFKRIDENRKARVRQARERRKAQKSAGGGKQQLDPSVLEELQNERADHVKPVYTQQPDDQDTTHGQQQRAQQKQRKQQGRHVFFNDDDEEEDDHDLAGLPTKRHKGGDRVLFKKGPVKVVSLDKRHGGLSRPAKPSTLSFIAKSRTGRHRRAPKFRRMRRPGTMAPTFGVGRQ